MKNKNFQTKYVAVALGLLSMGLICLFAAEYISSRVWGNVVSEIGSAILISGILGIIDEYVLKESLVELILNKMNIKDTLNNTGLEELVSGITEINYKYYFKNAKNCIDIVHIYGQTWTNNNIDEITERVVNGNCKVRVILVDPGSEFVPALEKHFEYEDGKLSRLIKEVSKVWKSKHEKKQERRKRVTQGSIQLFYHKGQPTNAMYRIDDRVIVVQTKTTREKTTRMPAMIFKDTNKKECFYNIYLKEIEQLIKESREVEFNEL